MTATARMTSPYRGLAPFGESSLDGLLFFGRERETEVTTANLLASRLTVLYGPSGVGKSSLLRAGVARRVRELGARRAIGRGPDLACVVFASWAHDPADRLAEAIEETVRPLVHPTALGPPEGASLADVAEHWSGVLDGDLCIVLDQLEEYFVYHGPDDSFLEQLPELVLRPGLRANVLLSLRDDELARLGVLRARIPNVYANARVLERLDRDSARAAILGPLERRNELDETGVRVDIEGELVEAVLDETSLRDEPQRVEAPYLQLVMQRVWEEEQSDGSRLLRLETLRELGGAEAVVREHLDRALSALSPGEQAAAALMFEHLVTPSGTKIAHRGRDLAAFAHVDPGTGRTVLDSLGHERILRPLDDADEDGRYEIFHDVLAQAVLEWGRGYELTSERERARRHQRQLIRLAIGALAAAVVLAGLTVYAFSERGRARSQARHAGASALAADALAGLPFDPQQSLQLATRAARRDPTQANEDILRSALMAARGRAVLTGNDRGVLATAFSGGGVISVDGAGVLHSYTLHSGGPRTSRRLGGRVRAAAISANGEAIVIARRRLVEVRYLHRSHANFAFRAHAPVRAVAIDRTGDRVAVAANDDTVTVRARGGTIGAVRTPFTIRAVALDRSGDTVAAAGGHRAKAWRVSGWQPVVDVRERADVGGVALAPDGGLLATAAADGAARLRAVPGGEMQTELVTTDPLAGVAFSPDGAYVVTRARTGVVRAFRAVDGAPVSVLTGHTDSVTTAAFSGGGRSLVTGSVDGTARVWDPGTAVELRVVARPAGCCTAVAGGPPGVLVAAGDDALLYDHGRAVRTYHAHSQVTGVAFAGATAVTAGRDGRVRFWGTAARTLAAGGPVTALAASPTRVAAAIHGGTVVVWSAEGRKLAAFKERAAVDGLAISPDGRFLATAGADSVARLRELSGGKLVHELPGHKAPVTGVAFTPDGTILATSSIDDTVRLWDVSTGAPGPVIHAHFARVNAVSFSADGRWLVSAGPSTAGLFRMPSGRFLTYLHGHGAPLVGATFVADDRTIVTASRDGSVRTARCDVCGTLPELLQLADRRLAASVER
jgi:WD40 repeat protein